jgi:hypothetical protein
MFAAKVAKVSRRALRSGGVAFAVVAHLAEGGEGLGNFCDAGAGSYCFDLLGRLAGTVGKRVVRRS